LHKPLYAIGEYTTYQLSCCIGISHERARLAEFAHFSHTNLG
jgi:hypothetical protein